MFFFVDKKDKAKFYNFFYEARYVNPENIFETIFGEHHQSFTWSHASWEGFHFRGSSFGFRRAGESRRQRVESESEDESDDDDTCEAAGVGSHAHRVTLGLPPCGPLTLDDVKTAWDSVSSCLLKLLFVSATVAKCCLPLTPLVFTWFTPCSFRASALRWHPDKHPGSSQVTNRLSSCGIEVKPTADAAFIYRFSQSQQSLCWHSYMLSIFSCRPLLRRSSSCVSTHTTHSAPSSRLLNPLPWGLHVFCSLRTLSARRSPDLERVNLARKSFHLLSGIGAPERKLGS